PRHARAVEHRDDADHAVARDEDRAALLLPAVLRRGASVRSGSHGVAVPGPAWADGVALARGLPPDAGAVTGEPPVRPPLDHGLADPHHLLVLPQEVRLEDVEALAVSRSEAARWVGPSQLELEPGVQLTGPWGLDPGLRAGFDLPAWADHAYLL